MEKLDGVYIEIPELTAFREQTQVENVVAELKMAGALSREAWWFSIAPFTEENFAEAVRQWVSAVSHVSADKITVTVTDGEIHIAYDAGVAEISEIRMEVEQ